MSRSPAACADAALPYRNRAMTKKTEDSPRIRRSSRRRASSPAAAIRSPITASSIRRFITPRPCFIARPRIISPTAAATSTAGAARRPRKRWRTRSRARRPRLRRRRAAAVGARGGVDRAAGSAPGRRPRAGHRQRLSADAEILRQRAQALRRRHDLLRSADRRRHRRADAAQHARGLSSNRRARSRSRCRTCRRSPRPRMRAARWC